MERERVKRRIRERYGKREIKTKRERKRDIVEIDRLDRMSKTEGDREGETE